MSKFVIWMIALLTCGAVAAVIIVVVGVPLLMYHGIVWLIEWSQKRAEVKRFRTLEYQRQLRESDVAFWTNVARTSDVPVERDAAIQYLAEVHGIYYTQQETRRRRHYTQENVHGRWHYQGCRCATCTQSAQQPWSTTRVGHNLR